jgi:type VI secretion system secreted protein VgrG
MLGERVARVVRCSVNAGRLSASLAARAALVLAVGVLVSKPLIANAAQPPVGLGTADSFAVLAGQGITNTGSTTITGDVGTYPNTSEAGFTACPGAADCVTLTGTNHAGDNVTKGAKSDLITAYNDAAGRTPVTTIATELGGQILNPGVYDSSSGTFGITGTLTLDALGDPDGVFIFQMASTLITASSSVVSLLGNASACNVYWQVGSSATLGTDSTFTGNIFALTSIQVQTAVTVEGRVFARNASVTLDTDTITRPICAAPTTPPATTPPGTTPSDTAIAAATTPFPSGGPATGGGSTAGIQDLGLLVTGGVLLAIGVGAFSIRRRDPRRGSSS